MATRRDTHLLLWLADLLSASFRCARLSKSAGCKPPSIGRLRVGRLETRVEWAFQLWVAGNARKHWASGQGLRRCPFYVGFRAGVAAGGIVGLWRCCGRSAAAGGGDSAGDAFFPCSRQCDARHCPSADSRSDVLLLLTSGAPKRSKALAVGLAWRYGACKLTMHIFHSAQKKARHLRVALFVGSWANPPPEQKLPIDQKRGVEGSCGGCRLSFPPFHPFDCVRTGGRWFPP